MLGIGKKIRKLGEKIEGYENKLVERIFRNKVMSETYTTGKIGKELKEESTKTLPDIYKQMISKDSKNLHLPILPDEAEIWIRKIYSDKSNERKLESCINEILEKISDEKEKVKAKIYLTKFYRKVISATATIKDEVMKINEILSRLSERTLDEIEEIKDRKKEENTVKKLIKYGKKILRYALQVFIPSGGIRILENVSIYIKDMDFVQKAIIAFSVFAIEEAIVNYYLESRRRKKIDELYNEYDKKEQELMEKARKIMDSIISSTVKDLEDIARQIYGCVQREDKSDGK